MAITLVTLLPSVAKIKEKIQIEMKNENENESENETEIDAAAGAAASAAASRETTVNMVLKPGKASEAAAPAAAASV